MTRYTVVGLPHGAVRESRDRIWAALKNSGLPVPRGAITINQAPADVRKESAAFDLPLANGLVAAAGDHLDADWLNQFCLMGELALDGVVRPVKGVLPMAMKARSEGKRGVVVPSDNAAEAAIVDGVEVYPVRTVTEAFLLFADPSAEKAPCLFH